MRSRYLLTVFGCLVLLGASSFGLAQAQVPFAVSYASDEGVCITGGAEVDMRWCSGPIPTDNLPGVTHSDEDGVCVSYGTKLACTGPIPSITPILPSAEYTEEDGLCITQQAVGNAPPKVCTGPLVLDGTGLLGASPIPPPPTEPPSTDVNSVGYEVNPDIGDGEISIYTADGNIFYIWLNPQDESLAPSLIVMHMRAKWADCPSDWVCLYQDINYNAETNARMIKFRDCCAWQNLFPPRVDPTFNDQLSSWRNRMSKDAHVSWHRDGNPQAASGRLCMNNNSSDAWVGNNWSSYFNDDWNDQASAIQIHSLQIC